MHTHFILRTSVIFLLVFLFCPSIYAEDIPPCPSMGSSTPSSGSSTLSSFNLDFHTTFTGLPETYGAASGQTGNWVDISVGTTNGLADTSGTATLVSITVTGRGDPAPPAKNLINCVTPECFRWWADS